MQRVVWFNARPREMVAFVDHLFLPAVSANSSPVTVGVGAAPAIGAEVALVAPVSGCG